jgi:beta-glucosidase
MNNEMAVSGTCKYSFLLKSVRSVFLFMGCFFCLISPLEAKTSEPSFNTKKMDRFIDDLIRRMTLDEKVGQMHQIISDFSGTGPLNSESEQGKDLRAGRIGSINNVAGAEASYKLQKIAVEESRLHIPLIFAFDVIHGLKTIFPIPLAEASSWDLPAMERSARIAAVEASAMGIHWALSPMVDIARDPRWGRIAEGAGEDPYLGSLIAKARVKGLQGDDLGKNNTIVACAKHYAAYGAGIAGRDYNAVDMSERTLREVYLPPYKHLCPRLIL